MRYQVTALFDRPVHGLVSRSSEESRYFAFSDRGAESAARKWLWKISPAERAATVRLIVSAPLLSEYRPYPIYTGETVEFERLNGRLERGA